MSQEAFQSDYELLLELRKDVMKWAKPMQLARQPKLGGVLHAMDEFLSLLRPDGRNLKMQGTHCVVHLTPKALGSCPKVKRYIKRQGLMQKTKHYRKDRFDVSSLHKETPAVVGVYLNLFHEFLAA